MMLSERLQGARMAWWMRACDRVGADLRLHSRPSVTSDGGAIRVGARCLLSSSPVTSHFVAGPDAVLEIGDDVSVAHGAAVAAFERVQIGSGTRIGPFVIIMDTNFHGSSGGQSVQHDCRPIAIGRNVCIGTRVTITRGVSIGDGAEILAGSVVTSSIPAGACAAGARARVIGSAGQLASRWDAAVAMLPFVLMDVLDIGTPPDMNDLVFGIPGWHDAAIQRLLPAIHAQFGVLLDAGQVQRAGRVGDLAVAVEKARRTRTESRQML
jgi:acetyltransferase-like isoleucine patch superfamily enzyme